MINFTVQQSISVFPVVHTTMMYFMLHLSLLVWHFHTEHLKYEWSLEDENYKQLDIIKRQ